MSRIRSLCGFLVFLVGCSNGADQDPVPIYEAILKHEFPGKDNNETVFLFIDGKDPAPELLHKLRQQLPKLEAGSKVPKGRAIRFDVGEMKAERDSAELRGTVSNGMDGKTQRFWLARKNGIWVVEKAKVEESS